MRSLSLIAFAALSSCTMASAAQPVPAADEGAPVAYSLPREAFATVNITRPDGWVVRELIVGEKQRPGRHEAFWDGRDNNGRILPPGSYEVRVLHHTGIAWDYVTSIGNGGTPPWQTADHTGGWGGNHGNALAVAVDDTAVYMGWTSTEGPYCVLKRTLDGSRGIWGIHLGPFEGVTHLAADGRHLYALNPRKLRKINRDTGRVLVAADVKSGKPEDAKDAVLVSPADSVTGSFTPEHGERWMGGVVWGLAVVGERVYVSNPWRDVIDVFDAGNLQPVPAENIRLIRPRGLAPDGKGGLLAVSTTASQASSLLAVDVKSREWKPIPAPLDCPFAVARGTDGVIYVAEAGTSHQVKKLGPDGKLLAAFGRKGGGTDFDLGTGGGQFQPQDFRSPAALAVNPDGSFWVVEDNIPKRIARFSPDGKLLYQAFGSVNYAALVAPNPSDPEELFSTMWGVFSARVDYAKKTWAMGRILRSRMAPGGIEGLDPGGNPARLLARGGKTYMWTGSGLAIVEKDCLRPVVCFFPRIPDTGPLAELAKQRNAKNRGWNTDATIWCDTNGNAAAQPDEVQFVPLPNAKHGPQYFGNCGIADDFSLITWGYHWKPSSFTDAGVPLYRTEGLVCEPAFNADDFSWAGESPMRDSQGNYYLLKNDGVPAAPHGNGFWSGRTSGSFLASYRPDWSPRWMIGRHAARTAKPGEMYYLWKTDGEMKDCVFISDVEGIVHVVHRDGFYVQSIMQDNRASPRPGPDVINVENFSGCTFVHPKTGVCYFCISSSEAASVFEIKGLDSIAIEKPAAVELRRPAVPPLAAAARAQREYMVKRLPPGAQAKSSVVPNEGIDWMRDVPPLLIDRDGSLAAEVRLACDGKKLYVLAHVLGEPGLHNSGTGKDAVKNAQDAGDTIELLVGGDPAADPRRTTPARGDARLIFAGSRPWCQGIVKMQPVADAPGTPLGFDGPAGKTTMDVSWVDCWHDGKDPSANGSVPFQRNGYVLQLAIPLEEVFAKGFDLAAVPGSRIRFDAGVTWGEPGGKNTAKAFWSGRNPKMLVVDDASVEAQLYPDGWGFAVFEGQPAARGDALEAPRAAAPVKIDGDPAGWQGAAAVVPGPAGEPAARVQLAWDDRALYALVRVVDSSPLRNNASTPEMMIKNGDVVALCFGPAGGKGVEQKIAAARLGKDTLVLAYRPKSDVKKPAVFASPVSSVTLDYVAPLPEVKAALAPAAGGYAAELAIPWSVLGIEPKAGLELPFDVQVILSDAGGSVNAFNAWWHSRSAESACTVDLPTEAKLYPAHWGKLVLK